MIMENGPVAIVLAAGYSSRMVDFKPLLPLGKTTIVEHVVDLFLKSGVSDIRVVVGYRAAELMPFLEKRGVRCIANPRYEEGMFSSVTAGVKSLEVNPQAFFILPVDIPLVRPQTIDSLIGAFERDRGEILHPSFQGQRGHPPLISPRFVRAILSWKGEGGLQGFLNQNEEAASEIAVADESILSDLDIPADYERILSRYERYEFPTVRECSALMREVFAVEAPVFDHCRAVARCALGLGRALNIAGGEIDLHLVIAAGLLHDLARTRPQHETVAAQTLAEMGFHKVAEVVGAHMDIAIREEAPITEKELIYLADKLVQGHRVVPLERRFRKMKELYAEDPAASGAISLRLDNALRIKQRLEAATGKSLDDILEKLPAGFPDDLSD